MVTFPVAWTMTVVLDPGQRQWLWETLRSKQSEQRAVREVIRGTRCRGGLCEDGERHGGGGLEQGPAAAGAVYV